MSAGGALGGLFTALIAPLVFDWAWEHPLLVVAAGAADACAAAVDWRRLPGLDPAMARMARLRAAGAWSVLAVARRIRSRSPGAGYTRLPAGCCMSGRLLLVPWRWAFCRVLALMMLAQGGSDTIHTSSQGARTRSYFGIYTVRDYRGGHRMRTLAHGTTLHGQQSLDPAQARSP